MGVSIVMRVAQKWMVDFIENPDLKWMTTGGTPISGKLRRIWRVSGVPFWGTLTHAVDQEEGSSCISTFHWFTWWIDGQIVIKPIKKQKWRFPKIGLPPNHPHGIFYCKPSSYGGTFMYGTPQIAASICHFEEMIIPIWIHSCWFQAWDDG